MGEASDHASGALVEVWVQACEGLGLVLVEPERGLDRRQQTLPLGVERERPGMQERAPAGDLVTSDAGEQPGVFDVDPRIDEGRGQVLGEVLEMVRQLLAGGGGRVHRMDLVDQDQIGAGLTIALPSRRRTK